MSKFKQTEIGKIPENWEVENLKEVCIKITDGSHFSPPTESTGKLIATVKDMKERGFDYSTCRIISNEDYEKLVKQDCKPLKDDVLIAKDGSYLKHVFVSNGKDEIVILSSIAILRPNQLKIFPDFLKYLFTDSKTKARVSGNYVSGAVIPRIVLRDFEKIDLPIPPLPEQRAIASILSSLDDKIELNNKMNKTLEAVGQALFKRWFVDFEFPNEEGKQYKSSGGKMVESELGEIPERWEVGKLGDVIEKIESGRRPKGGIDSSHFEIPSVGAENIRGLGKYDYSKTKFISKEFYDKMKTGIIKSKDVLLYKDGANIGRNSLFMNNFPFKECCVNEHVFILRSKKSFSQFFLYFWIDQKSMTQKIINLNSNAAQPGINQISVISLPILIIDNATRRSFDLFIEPLLSKIFYNCLQNRRLSQIRDSLLPKLMSGVVRVR
ncbi:MAG: restriction endonuclease subunit S [Nanoarchaeota archaeon]|nr:restriction endonuclease subunit S [Nanoarchaeota archaeon]